MMKRVICILAVALMAGSAGADLVAHYDFEAGQGDTVFDQAPSPANGTRTGFADVKPAWSTDAAMGNYSMQFFHPTEGDPGSSINPGNNWVDAGAAGKFEITEAISIAAWLKHDGVATSTQYVASKWDDGAWRLRLRSTNTSLRLATAGSEMSAEIDLSDGGWHHFVMTYDSADGGVGTVYIDNELVTTDTGLSGSISAGGGTLFLGAKSTGGSDVFSGSIDDFGIWNHALSEGEIDGIYSNGIPEPATMLLIGLGAPALLRLRRKA